MAAAGLQAFADVFAVRGGSGGAPRGGAGVGNGGVARAAVQSVRARRIRPGEVGRRRAVAGRRPQSLMAEDRRPKTDDWND